MPGNCTGSDDGSKDHLLAVLDAIRNRMHADGHFIFPVIINENDENSYGLRTIQTRAGGTWYAAFTSHTEFEKGEPSGIISHFIDSMLKDSLDTEAAGFIINPWRQSFMLARGLIDMIFKVDGAAEYTVPDTMITAEILEDWIKLAKILRDSWVWAPCTAILSDADNEAVERAVMEAAENSSLRFRGIFLKRSILRGTMKKT